jgi:hypothetical protein
MFKSKGKSLILAGLAVIVAGGVVPAAASATPVWRVRGSVLTGGSEGITATFLTVGGGLTAVLTSKLPGGKIEVIISCKISAIVGGKITAPNKGSASKLAFKGCKLDSKECKLTSPETTEITTLAVTAEAVDLAGAEPLFVTFKPTSGTIFAAIDLVACAGEGKFNVSGVAACRMEPTATDEQELHLCAFEGVTLLNTLKFGTEPATLRAFESFTLVNGGDWSSEL